MLMYGKANTISAVAKSGCNKKWLYSECRTTATLSPGSRR